jgi:hypothetical protein
MKAGCGLPDFLIIGAAKAGTTALWHALSRHPQIFMSPVKEPWFFAYPNERPHFPSPGGDAHVRKLVTVERDYRQLFAKSPEGSVAGEASQAYLSSRSAPDTAASYVPEARIIAILRDPVERAFSQYLHLRNNGLEPLADFRSAFEAHSERKAAGWNPTFLYRDRGHYGEQIDRWLGRFAREKVLVLLYEDWRDAPQATIGRIHRHLGVRALPDLPVTEEHVSSRRPWWPSLHQRMIEDNAVRRLAQRRLPLWMRDAITSALRQAFFRPGPKLDSALKALLAPLYEEDIRRVEALTSRDLSGWRSR